MSETILNTSRDVEQVRSAAKATIKRLRNTIMTLDSQKNYNIAYLMQIIMAMQQGYANDRPSKKHLKDHSKEHMKIPIEGDSSSSTRKPKYVRFSDDVLMEYSDGTTGSIKNHLLSLLPEVSENKNIVKVGGEEVGKAYCKSSHPVLCGKTTNGKGWCRTTEGECNKQSAAKQTRPYVFDENRQEDKTIEAAWEQIDKVDLSISYVSPRQYSDGNNQLLNLLPEVSENKNIDKVGGEEVGKAYCRSSQPVLCGKTTNGKGWCRTTEGECNKQSAAKQTRPYVFDENRQEDKTIEAAWEQIDQAGKLSGGRKSARS